MSADISNYAGLITPQHADRPKFVATVSLGVQPAADAGALLNSMVGLFDVDTAVGAQLDAVGVRVGASRYLNEPLTGVYFSFDTAGVGFDQGSWLGPFDPTSGLVALPDDTFRVLIKAIIAANQWDGTTPDAYAVYAELFGALGGQILIFDNQDMSITIGYIGAPPNAVVNAMLTGGLLSLNTAGVGITGYITPSVLETAFFGFDAQNAVIAGFDYGAWEVAVGTPTSGVPGALDFSDPNNSGFIPNIL